MLPPTPSTTCATGELVGVLGDELDLARADFLDRDVDRVDAHTIRFVGKDMTEISKFIEFTTSYRVDITP